MRGLLPQRTATRRCAARSWPGTVWLAGLFAASLLPNAAWGSVSLNQLRAEVSDLEQQAGYLAIHFKGQSASKEQIAEHRLVDAQVLYTLKDYTRAAILLLDYVSKYKNSRGYDEALFFLADSLFYKRDYLSAKRYFEQITQQVRGRYYQEALQRLIELSLITGDYSNVDSYLSALASIPPYQLKPSVPYVQGKYYFFRDDFGRSQSAFRAIPGGHRYYLHAQYFLGAILVKQGNIVEASRFFENLLKAKASTDSEKHIRDLTFLAMGRLLYERGETGQAISMYEKVPRQSSEFDAALYEIAWAYIKAGDLEKALRSLDLLVLAHPDSTFIPQVQVLQGNLLIRLEQWKRATELFTKTREKFLPVQNRMKQVLTEHSNPNTFFDVLLARNLGELSATIQVPPLAVMWVKEIPTVKRALSLVQDVREINESLKEATQLIRRLEHAVNTPAKIKIFPEFAAAKASSLEVENRLLMVRKKILDAEAELVRPAATGREQEEMRNQSAQRDRFEQAVKELPTTSGGYENRQKEKLLQIEELEHRLNELSITIDSLRAQLVAAEKFFADTSAAKGQAVREQFRADVNDVQGMINGLQSEADEVNQSLQDAKSSVGVGGAEEVAERGIKGQYLDSLGREHALLAGLRSRLGSGSAADFDVLASLFERSARIDQVLKDFDRRLEAGVEEKLMGIRATINEEKVLVKEYEVQAADYKNRTDTVAGEMTHDGFREIATRFYEIVVRADVGIIDVAWALKDAKTQEVSRLVRQQKMDLKVLDEEFKEVLQKD